MLSAAIFLGWGIRFNGVETLEKILSHRLTKTYGSRTDSVVDETSLWIRAKAKRTLLAKMYDKWCDYDVFIKSVGVSLAYVLFVSSNSD